MKKYLFLLLTAIAVCSTMVVGCGDCEEGKCSADDTADASDSSSDVNEGDDEVVAPMVNAGQKVSIARCNEWTDLLGSVSGDYDSAEWSVSQKPTGAKAEFDDEEDPETAVMFDRSGSYILHLSATNEGKSRTSSITIFVSCGDHVVDDAGVHAGEWPDVVPEDADEDADSEETDADTDDDNLPTADAGEDFNIQCGELVELSGFASGDEVKSLWEVAQEPTSLSVTFSDETDPNSDVMFSESGTYVLNLSVFNAEYSDVDSLIVSVSSCDATNFPPIANAGPNRAVLTDEIVTLNGSGTDPEGQALTCRWEIISDPPGSGAELSDYNVCSPTFRPIVSGSYTFGFYVNDGKLESAVDIVIITASFASAENLPPTANAGDNQKVYTEVTVTLNGSGADPEGQPLSCRWEKLDEPTGSNVVLVSPNTCSPTFVPTIVGNYFFKLYVSDGELESEPDLMLVMASVQPAENIPPTANAGENQTVFLLDTVTLHGTGTDQDDDVLTCRWLKTSEPDDSIAELLDSGVCSPQFSADAVGNFVFTLYVSYGEDESAPSAVIITVLDKQFPPTVSMGADRNITLNASYELSAEVSDPNKGDTLAYTWSFDSVPSGSTASLSSTSAVKPKFTPNVAGNYVVRLSVNDGEGGVTEDTVTLTAIVDPNVFTLPIVVAEAWSADPESYSWNSHMEYSGDGEMKIFSSYSAADYYKTDIRWMPSALSDAGMNIKRGEIYEVSLCITATDSSNDNTPIYAQFLEHGDDWTLYAEKLIKANGCQTFQLKVADVPIIAPVRFDLCFGAASVGTYTLGSVTRVGELPQVVLRLIYSP
ncbi:MAG: PKD domain-containing protein [bacterium]